MSDLYGYNKIGKMFLFDGLDKYLLDKGVSEEHILKMKNKILMSDEMSEYSEFEEDSYEMLVPLDKVVGVSRGTPGWSVYDNVRMIGEGDREPRRFQNCLEYNEYDLDKLRESYHNMYYPVNMYYYVDEDAYYISTDGNHRTLTAMLVGADKIKANVINAYCNNEKKKKYMLGKDFEKKYSIECVTYCNRDCCIHFRDEKGTYLVFGYELKKESETIELYLERLAARIDRDKKIASIINKMPYLIKMILLSFLKGRIYCYVDKNYIGRHKMIKGYDRQIIWTNL